MIESWLLQSFVIFLIVGSLAGMFVGVLLLLRPQSVYRLNERLNRWVSTRHLDQSLERSVNLDPWFYRYSRPGGALILLGAAYVLYYFTAILDRPVVIDGLVHSFKLHPVLIGGLLDAVALGSILGALCAALVGLFLLLRPSMLRDFEQMTNQWISLRRAMKPVEVRRAGVDEYVFRHGQRVAILLILGSLYVLVLLLTWIGR